MTLLEFIRLIARHWKVLVIFPLMTAGVVFYLTRNTKKEYVSNTQVYTGIASGYGITSGENDRVDYFAVNNAFDNLMATIKSRETLEEVGMRLLAKHLLIEKPAYKDLSPENFEHIRESIPEKLRKKLIVKGSEELTFFRIESYKRASENNEIIALLSAPSSIYSVEVISSKMNPQRKQSSDMIEISYQSNDPAVCQQTLQTIVNVVITRYKGIKGAETSNVVKYFEEQLNQAAGRLRKSEDRLRDYSSENKIINFYEQAKFVANSKENVISDKQKQEESLEASRAALKKIEQKIDIKKNILEINENLTKLREQLSEVTYKIANAELYNEEAQLLDSYRKEADRIKKEIRDEVNKQYKWNNTPEGLPRANLLSEWLGSFLAVEENQAKLDVINKRLNSFDELYKEMAPVGSNLKRIEREVDINEKEYLSILHGLNMARLRQQSLQMSNNLSITDYPFLPLKPQPSKRAMMIIMAFIATFVLSLSIVVGKSFIGKTVQTPARAEKFTKLTFLTAFPHFDKIDTRYNIAVLRQSILAHFSSTFQTSNKSIYQSTGKPPVISISSIKKNEGKSFIGKMISGKFTGRFNNVLYLTPDEVQGFPPTVTTISYQKSETNFNGTTIYDWFPAIGIDASAYDLIILELDEIGKYSINDNLIKGISGHLFIVSAERVWAESDSRALALFTKMTETPPFIILNHVEIDRMEAIIGELPKQRTFVRKAIKRVVTFNFKRS